MDRTGPILPGRIVRYLIRITAGGARPRLNPRRGRRIITPVFLGLPRARRRRTFLLALILFFRHKLLLNLRLAGADGPRA